jgi:hypothetical protein
MVASAILASASAEMQSTNERPIAKILKLLRDMKTQMEAEGEDDVAVHEKYQCWCKKEKEEKSNIEKKQAAEMKKQDAAAKGAFSESQKKSEKRLAVFEEFTGKQKSLEELNQKCMDEKSDFSKEDQEIEKSIIACRNAITVLKKHNFVQLNGKLDNRISNKNNNKVRKALQVLANSNGIQKHLAMTNAEGLVAI